MSNLLNQYDENGLKHGLWRYEDKGGNAWCELEYKKGVLHGRFKEIILINNREWLEEGYHDNGQKIGHWKRTRKYKTTEVIYIQ